MCSSIGKYWFTELRGFSNCSHGPLYNNKYARLKKITFVNIPTNLSEVFTYWKAVKLTVVQVFQTAISYWKARILSLATNMSIVFLEVSDSLSYF